MDKDIKRENRIPGCDRLTRPEEVKGLSKFLGKLKKRYEDNLDLNEDNLEVPGRTTGKLPKINELPSEVIARQEPIAPVGDSKGYSPFAGDLLPDEFIPLGDVPSSLSLEDEVIGLRAGDEVTELENFISTLEIHPDLIELPENSTLLPDSVDTFTEELTDFVDVLSIDSSIDTLPEELLKIEGEIITDISLPEILITGITADEVDELPDTVDNLYANNEVDELPDTVDNLYANNEVDELPDTVDNLYANNEVDELSDIVDNLYANNEVDELPDTVDNLYANSEVDELPDTVDNLYANNEVDELPDTVDNLYANNEVDELPDTVDNLYANNEVDELPDTVDNLNANNKVDELSDVLDNLFVDNSSEIELEDKVVKILSANSSGNYNYLDINSESVDNIPEYVNDITDFIPDPTAPSIDNDYGYIDKDYKTAEGLIFGYEGTEDINLDTPPIIQEGSEHAFFDINSESTDNMPGYLSTLSEKLTDPISPTVDAAYGFIDKDYKSADGLVFGYEGTDNVPLNTSPEVQEGNVHAYFDINSETADNTPEYVNSINDLSLKVDDGTDEIELTSGYVSPVSALTIDETDNINLSNEGYSDSIVEDYPNYKLPSFSLDSLNISTGIRWLVEEAVDITGLHGEKRRLILDEALALAIWGRDEVEKAARANRDRLPGNDYGLASDLVSGGVSGAVGNLGSRIEGAMTANALFNPVNRPPESEVDKGRDTALDVTGWHDVSNTATAGKKTNAQKLLQAAIGVRSGEENYSFAENYLDGEGIRITLEDLCGRSDLDAFSNATVGELFTALKNSAYISQPEKFTKTGWNSFKYFTLDTNSYWEVIFTPYVGKRNGYQSFLPAIREINSRNFYQHGIVSEYDRWIPFSSFDLQKSKMMSKSLSLYEGEMVVPVGMDFINEFRLTLVDDQYKSWRRYFEECAKSAIYASSVHDENHYISDFPSVTDIDETTICIAPYKNVTFRCTIYQMTPQYSTIKKYDLLLLLKDFVEEYSGEIDAPGTDLTLSFSIVGENPGDDITVATTAEKMKAPTKEEYKIDWATVAGHATDSVIGIL